MKTFSIKLTEHIARLANIPLKPEEVASLARGFTQIIAVVEKLQYISVADTDPLHHVTDLHTVFREDVADEASMFTQEEALANAPSTYNGFFATAHVFDFLE